VQVTGVAPGPARGRVAAGERPAPLREHHVQVGKFGIPGVGEIIRGFGRVPVGLQQDQLVPSGDERVHDWAAPEPAAIGSVYDAGAKEAPEAVPDSQRRCAIWAVPGMVLADAHHVRPPAVAAGSPGIRSGHRWAISHR
jgi:hypothetical protein